MRLSNTLRLSIASLTAHPFRSFLAGLGVVFGVGAVVGMLAIGEGARLESIRQIQEMGVDKILIQSVAPEGGQEGAQATSGVTEDDIRHIESEFDNVTDVLPITGWRGTVISQWVQKPGVHILGVPVSFPEITKASLVDSQSRFINRKDELTFAPVCVLGSRIAKELFEFRNPVGERLMLKGVYHTVVGVLHHSSDREISGLGGINQMVYVPAETGFNVWAAPLTRQRITKFALIYVVVRDVDKIEDTARRMQAYMQRAHKDPDYKIILPFELMKQQEATQRIFTIVMASIASISLLVGGIGIMNIMLANIYERMKEIGTRRALGATRRDILIQFLVESIVLTASGGVLGAILGVLLAVLVAVYADMPTQVTIESFILSLSISVLTGVVFGSFPAWKAANLSPMEALRHE
ncbi:MAG: ABC transporter permease [Opitutales bacterium]